MASISTNKTNKKNGAGRFVVKKAKEIGASGTDINSGTIAEDYNTALQFPNSIDNYNQMRKSDAQVQAAIDAVILPLATANWALEIDERGSQEHKEFIYKALWKDLEVPFDHFIQEALLFLVFGFYYFEKVFKVDESGNVVWKYFAPRIPSAHLYWKTEEGNGSGESKNQGVTQQLPSYDYRGVIIGNSQPQIPMDKLLLFTNRQEGDNFEGTSILRSAYKHWHMKELSYKIQMISNERYGVGVPVMTLPKGANNKDITTAEGILKNLRSNEKSFIVLKEGWEFDIKSPQSDSKAGAIKDAIEHHNRMILMSVLAPFLDLGSSTTGSYSLGETQMNFFVNSLQNKGKYMSGIINKAIKELIEINYGEQEFYPELSVTEIGAVDKQVLMNAVKTGVDAGVIIVDTKLRQWTRENLNLPEEDEEEINQIQEEKKNQADLENQLKAIGSVMNGKDKEGELPKTQKQIQEEKEQAKKKSEFRERGLRKLAEEVKVSKREKIFQRVINEHEKDLQRKWDKVYLPMLEETEKSVIEFLLDGYGKARKDYASGVQVFSRTGNMTLHNEMRRGIKERFDKLSGKISAIAYRTHRESAKSALKAMLEMEDIKQLADIVIEKGQIDAFVNGHLSNVNGFIFNEGRQLTELLLDNLTQTTSVNLVLDQTKNWKMNKNITKLSIITHPRSAFRNVIFLNAEKQGIGHWKPIVPSFMLGDVSAAGYTAGILFLILTTQQLNKKGNENANIVGGMSTHHGSYDYFYPIDEENYDEEVAIARIQRKQFLESIK